MPYSITTQDGITIQNIPDNVPQDAQELKDRVTQLRSGQQAPVAQTSTAQPDKTNFLERTVTGLADPIHGSAQLLEKSLPGAFVQKMNRLNNYLVDRGVPLARLPESGVSGLVQQREQEYQARRGSEAGTFDPFRAVGNVIPAVLATRGIGMPSNLTGRAAQGAALGGGLSATAPVTEPGNFASQKLNQIATGAAIGGAIPVGTQLASSSFKRLAANRDVANQANNAVRNATLEESGKAGYFVPRSTIKPGLVSNLGDRAGGKVAIQQTAEIKNQAITDRLAKAELKIPANIPMTDDLLRDMRLSEGKIYETIKNMGVFTTDKSYKTNLRGILKKYSGASDDFPELAKPDVQKLISALDKETITAKGAIEQVKNLRSSATESFRKGEHGVALAQREAAEALDNLIERNIEPNLGKTILSQYRLARKNIAKIHDVEDALNESGGNVNAVILGRKLEKNLPLSGNLKTIAKFSRANPLISRVPKGAPASGGFLEPMIFGAGGAAALASPAGIAAAAIPYLGKPIVRQLMTVRASPATPSMFGSAGRNVQNLNRLGPLIAQQIGGQSSYQQGLLE